MDALAGYASSSDEEERRAPQRSAGGSAPGRPAAKLLKPVGLTSAPSVEAYTARVTADGPLTAVAGQLIAAHGGTSTPRSRARARYHLLGSAPRASASKVDPY